VATNEELRDAINDYVVQMHKSARVTRALRHWNCVIYVEAVDLGQGLTIEIRNAQATVREEASEKPDLIVRGQSEDLANIFWCDANPASAYMQGVITTQGSQEDVLRLDAVAALIYLEMDKE
jgi:putative sterol carrier protein